MNKYRGIKKRKATELIEKVATNIKKYRTKAGLSQEEVEEKTGITVSRCESGKNDMKLTTIGILSRHLNLQPWELLK